MSSNIPGGPKSPALSHQEMAKHPSTPATLPPPQASSCPDPAAPGEQTARTREKTEGALKPHDKE